MLYIEVHSGTGVNSYEEMLTKLMMVMANQLRLLRNYQHDMSKCIGFVFPKEAHAKFVMEVTLTWIDKLKFQFHGKCLAKEEVIDRVKLAVDEMHRLVRRIGQIGKPQYFIPLSSTQLQSFGAGAEQKPSRSSIIVYNENDYFKLFPNVKYRETRFALKARAQREYHNLLITKDVKDIGDHTTLSSHNSHINHFLRLMYEGV